MNKLKFLWFILTVSLSIFCLTTCDSPLGMGPPIDWEPPVLTLDPVPNPFYVKPGTVLTGTATDNVGVTRVEFLDSNGKQLFPVELTGTRFRIVLNFPAEYDGKKIVAEIRAYDKMNNSGGTATKFVTLIIDNTPPMMEYIEIKRTDTRISLLEPIGDLKALEGIDTKANLFRYQNGWFYVNAIVSDKETRVQDSKLEIYDADKDINKVLVSLDFDAADGYTSNNPRWTVKEEDIINAGQAAFGGNYKSDYYNGNVRYYYRVSIRAIDLSENVTKEKVEDYGYMCLWANSDKPRGIVDPAVLNVAEGEVANVSKNTSLPIEFYDDDSLYWAYTGLLKIAQWGENGAAGSVVTIPGSDKEKLNWIKGKLTGNTGTNPGDVELGANAAPAVLKDWANKDITNLITGNIDEKLVYLLTSNSDDDYGDYVLFTIAADKKLAPGNGTGPEWTNKGVWDYKIVKINLKNENAPLIVFDTKNGSPEENTFPQKTILKDGRYFTIKGYTLRENGNGTTFNKVDRFRMAWIPYGSGQNQNNENINLVKEALKKSDFSGMPLGVQYWEFTESGTGVTGQTGSLPLKITGKDDSGEDFGYNYQLKNDNDPNRFYTRQGFEKTFDVMGGADDIKTSSYDNFTRVKGDTTTFENETKLFIFYARDNMGNEIFRQLPILGFKSVPKLNIYDITYNIPGTDLPIGIPDPSKTDHIIQSSGSPSKLYYNALNAYNKRTDVIKSLSDSKDPETASQPFQMYPRGTTVKYWVDAENENIIPIKTLTMKDITYALTTTTWDGVSDPPSGRVLVGSDFDEASKTFSFVEYYPDVTQRTFLFEATDMLGNQAIIQRTVAISNAARLESITTTSQNGTYGDGSIITLQANFTNQIFVAKGIGADGLTTEAEKPKLNIRYQMKGTSGYKYDSLVCEDVPPVNATTDKYGLKNRSISLSFTFKVPTNATGVLETIYSELKDPGDSSRDRPVTIPGYTAEKTGTRIIDNAREDDAFVPGYSTKSITMPNWTTANNYSLQTKKEIKLDGVHPVITGVGFDPTAGVVKGPYTGSGATAERYFKTGESIALVITADKPIRALSSSRLVYIIKQKNGTENTYNAEFKYQKPATINNQLIYNLKVDSASCPVDGEIVRIYLLQNATSDIVDDWGNNIEAPATPNFLTTYSSSLGKIYIKQTKPVKPAATLANNDSGTSGLLESVVRTDFKGIVTIGIPNSTGTWSEWEDRKQYSLDGGSNWLPTTLNGTTTTQSYNITGAGTYNIQVRYLDRAGNEGIEAKKTIVIGDTFPKLVSVGTKESNGWYKAGTSLTFNLNFADTVTVTNNATTALSITVKNRASTTNTTTEEKVVYATAGQTGGTTVTFTWSNISGSEMRNGLYISNVNLAGLTDKFGITGPSGSTTFANVNNITMTPVGSDSYTCPNLTDGVKVDAIAPTVTVRNPAHITAPSNNILIKTITLTFSEPVIKGSGTITIRPRAGYAIPPVFDDTGYYIGYNTTAAPNATESADGTGAYPAKYYSAGANRTYVSSFYDIYNNNALTTADRAKLLKGASMANHDLNTRTGQSAGPYKKMTQGLIAGRGYSGDYTGIGITSGPNAPDTISITGIETYMIPDTATKWVLDYQYTITQNATVVNDIRNTLTKAKFRWQQIDVANTQVAIGTGSNTNVVTITLDEPLLKGLDWEVYYPAGTFADSAGNPAPASGNITTDVTTWTNSDYYFTSPGVQAPVIRVNRRSYDARNSNWSSASNRTYQAPGNTTNWSNADTSIADNGLAIDGGWGITDFNAIHYRVECETPGAAIQVATSKGSAGSGSSASASWTITDNVSVANSGAAIRTNMQWNEPVANTVGTWVLQNIIRRSRENANQTYTVITKNGISESRTSTTASGNLRMFRSYNKDMKLSGLSGLITSTTTPAAWASTKTQDVLTFNALESNKSYVTAQATKNGQSVKGYEGVFRTVIVLNYDGDKGSNFLLIEGSNIKNGMPSVAGFPVRDAEETGDNRFIKVFHHNDGTNNQNQNPRKQFYWVSTEIVCEWYFLCWGGGNSHQSVGEVNNYLTVGYGDLTYAQNIGQY